MDGRTDASPAFLGQAEKEIAPLLVVSRKVGQRILIGDKIAITVVKVSSGAVRIGVEAPPEMAVMREELAEELRRTEQAAIDAGELTDQATA